MSCIKMISFEKANSGTFRFMSACEAWCRKSRYGTETHIKHDCLEQFGREDSLLLDGKKFRQPHSNRVFVV